MNREQAIALLLLAGGVYFLVGVKSGQEGDSSRPAVVQAPPAPLSRAPAPKAQPVAAPAKAVAVKAPAPAAAPTPAPAAAAAPTPAPAVATPPSPSADTIWRVTVNSDDQALGRKDAPITAVVFTAFGCDTCRGMADLPAQMKAKFGKDVRVIMKHKILPPSPYALEASIAALAAGRQGKFWQYHDKLFANSPAFDEGSLVRYAQEVGLKVSRFKKDLRDDSLRGQVMKDTLLANEVGAHSMPNVLVNGVRMRGDKTTANAITLAEQELVKAKKGKKKYDAIVSGGKSFPQLDARKHRFGSATSARLGPDSAKIKIYMFEDFQ